MPLPAWGPCRRRIARTQPIRMRRIEIPNKEVDIMARMKSSPVALSISALFLLLLATGAWTPDRVQGAEETHGKTAPSMGGHGQPAKKPDAGRGQMMPAHLSAPAGKGKESAEPIRITMEELHRSGGIPPGWRFRLIKGDPEAGRGVFVKMECFACHEVAGEKFPTRDAKPTDVGPDLTGMGDMHPMEILFESVIHPNRVITQGPGFEGPDRRTIMPNYNHLLTVEEALDLVAYLGSLRQEGHVGQPAMAGKGEMHPMPRKAVGMGAEK